MRGTGLARGALDEAVAAAAAGDDQVDVAKLLSLAKVSVGRPPSRQKPWTAPRPKTAPVPSSRKAATALAATELQRQKVTPSRLRGLKVALRRSGETIDVDSLRSFGDTKPEVEGRERRRFDQRGGVAVPEE